MLGNGFAVDALVNQCRQPGKRNTGYGQQQSQREGIAGLRNNWLWCRSRRRRGAGGRLWCFLRMRCFFGMRRFLRDTGILHHNSLHFAGGKNSKANALRNVISIWCCDFGQSVVTGRQLFDIVRRIGGYPAVKFLAVLVGNGKFRWCIRCRRCRYRWCRAGRCRECPGWPAHGRP